MIGIKKLSAFLFISYFTAAAQNPLLIPDTLSGSQINLSLQTGTVQFYPQQVTNTYGINGKILGPTLFLRKNFPVSINVANTIADTTTIHWHGLHVSPVNDGGPHITIAPGSTWTPAFTVLDRASTYWYHPHLHEHTNEQVQKGLSAFIIVRDSAERALTLPRTYGRDDFPLLVQSRAFDTNKQIVIGTALDTALMVNATIKPYLNVPAQVVRLRLLNGSSERTYLFGLQGSKTFYQIGSDGGLLSAPVLLSRLRLSPGERAEILIDFGPYNGQSFDLVNYTTELPSGNYGAPQPGMGPGQTIPGYALNPLNTGTYTVIKFNVGSPTANPVTTIPMSLVTHSPWPQSSVQQSRSLTIMMSGGMGGAGALQGPFMFDNQMFHMDTINHRVPFNNTEIWTIRNQSPISHPFHIHDVQFYILDINGVAPPANQAGRKDVVLVPAGNGTVRFITKFETFCDNMFPYMYHCHMLTHEDDGLMGQFLVTCPSETTGLGRNTTGPDLKISPNPVHSNLFIHVEQSRALTYQLLDLFGRVLHAGILSPGDNQLDMSVLPVGMYLLRAEGDGLLVRKLVKE